MSLTIPELIEKLNQVDPTAQLAMFVGNRLVPVHEVIHMPSTPHVFLCEQPHALGQPEFTDAENGLIGYCAANGVKDDVIAALLGRAVETIARQRQRIGF